MLYISNEVFMKNFEESVLGNVLLFPVMIGLLILFWIFS